MTNGKIKGKKAELEIARIFRQHGYIDAKRSQQYCGADGDGDVIGVPNLHIEVKRRQAFDIKASLKQAEDDAREGMLPVVFYRANRKPWVAVLRWEIFSKIYQSSEKMLNLVARSSKTNLIYKWLEDAKKECTTRDSAIGNICPDGHYVFMDIEAFIEMYRLSDYGGKVNV